MAYSDVIRSYNNFFIKYFVIIAVDIRGKLFYDS